MYLLAFLFTIISPNNYKKKKNKIKIEFLFKTFLKLIIY